MDKPSALLQCSANGGAEFLALAKSGAILRPANPACLQKLVVNTLSEKEFIHAQLQPDQRSKLSANNRKFSDHSVTHSTAAS